MQGIYTYIPETNNVLREYTVAAILLLLFMVPISLVSALALLCFYLSTFRSTCMCAVPNMAVFCSSLTSWFPGMLLKFIIIIIIIITIIIIFVITFMQDIYNYIPETSHVSRVYSVAAVLYVPFVLHVILFRPWNLVCTFTLVLSVVCVQCPIWLLL
jgi:hypothetical protein